MNVTGMPKWSPGPFYSYMNGYTPTEMQEALDDLDEFIMDHGPFDGVVGFSQGASLAASYILTQQRQYPTQAPPFGFALFFSAVVAFSPDNTDCQQLIQDLLATAPIPFRKSFPHADFVALGHPDYRPWAEYLSQSILALDNIGSRSDAVDHSFLAREDTVCDAVPRPLHPRYIEDRIAIPTIHVTGKRDYPILLDQAQKLHNMCEERLTRVYRHSGGHEVPTKILEVKVIVKAIEWVVEEGKTAKALGGISRV